MCEERTWSCGLVCLIDIVNSPVERLSRSESQQNIQCSTPSHLSFFSRVMCGSDVVSLPFAIQKHGLCIKSTHGVPVVFIENGITIYYTSLAVWHVPES